MMYDRFKGQARLPKFAVPKRYDIRLKPDLITCTFTGTLSVDVDIVSPTEYIVLNAAELSVDSTSISFKPKSDSQGLRSLGVAFFEEDEILVVGFEHELPTGVGILSMTFEGTLNDEMKGFYRSVYEVNGAKRNMAVTQFEQADARRCFPCWDEPAAKARFKITVDVPLKLVALSNMPVIEEKREGDMKTIYFEESPIMSSYLVAVVVGLFDYIESQTLNGTKVRVYCEVGKAKQGIHALDVAVKTLELYHRYFDVPYSLPKLDMITIPDLSCEAMENYGLVTYLETALLYDDQHSTVVDKQRVAIVVAHELAHQWFGNIVTMEWWTHFWLKEGFATWVSYLVIDSLFPEWKIWTQFVDRTKDSLWLDGLAESHPVEVDVNSLDEIFSAIIYGKGASLLRMLQSYLGAQCFKTAIAKYINRYAYSNAKAEQLWAILEEESGEPVERMMESWTKKKGYPVVSVTLKHKKLVFKQSVFHSTDATGDGLWCVPITICRGSYDTCQNILLKTKSEVADFGDCSWLKLNVDQTGFYRVKYDENLAAKLRHAIESNQLSVIDRFGVLDDTYVLCMVGHQPLTSLLSLMSSFRGEIDYTVLSNLISISYKVTRIVADAAPEVLDALKQFFINIFLYPAMKLGWAPEPGESNLDAMLRGDLLTALVILGHDSTINEAIRRFQAFFDDRNCQFLPPDVRKASYTAVMQRVSALDKSGYEALIKLYRETDLSQEKDRILGSLTSCPDPTIVLEVLNFLLSSEVRHRDAEFELAFCREGRETAWKWLQDNWGHILSVWGYNDRFCYFVSAIVSLFASREKATEVKIFFASWMKPYIPRTMKQSLEIIHINSWWVHSIQKEHHLTDIIQELAMHGHLIAPQASNSGACRFCWFL